MIVDTSALIAVLGNEPEAPRIRELLSAYSARVSAATLVEARLVAFGKGGREAARQLEQLIRRTALEVVAVDAEQADAASEAYFTYGRGTGHSAKLNYGDAFSYALAQATDEPLLFVGDDFSRTDVRSALEEYL